MFAQFRLQYHSNIAAFASVIPLTITLCVVYFYLIHYFDPKYHKKDMKLQMNESCDEGVLVS